jgi:hypothetical protein
MHFIKAGEIIKVAREKIEDDRIWQRWLVELNHMDENNFLSFEKYKEKLYELARLKGRTKEEKEKDMEIAREKARKATQLLNPKGDMGKQKKVNLKKKKKRKVTKGVK